MPLSKAEQQELTDLEELERLEAEEAAAAPPAIGQEAGEPRDPLFVTNLPTRLIEAYGRGLVGQERERGLSARNVAEELGRGAGPMIGAALGTPGGIPGMAAGAAIGRLAQTGYQDIASIAGSGAPIKSPGEAIAEAGAEGAATVITSGALSGAAKYGLPVAERLIEYGAKNLGAVSGAAVDFIRKNLGAVVRNMGKGPADEAAIADEIRQAVAKTVEAGEQEYRATIAGAVRGGAKYGPGFRLNLMDDIGDKVKPILDEFGFTGPGRLEGSAAAKQFNEFAIARLSTLKSATPEKVYFFQRDLNALARDNRGTMLGAAYGKLAREVRGYLAEHIPEIGAANAKYAAAKTLEEEAGKLTGADDLAKFVLRTVRNPRETLSGEALMTVAGKVPAVAQGVEDIQGIEAAQAFSPLFRGLPQTGYGAALGGAAAATVYEAVRNPAARNLLPFAGAFSPYAYYGAFRAAEALRPAAAAVGRSAGPIGAAVAPTIADYYNRRRPTAP